MAHYLPDDARRVHGTHPNERKQQNDDVESEATLRFVPSQPQYIEAGGCETPSAETVCGSHHVVTA